MPKKTAKKKKSSLTADDAVVAAFSQLNSRLAGVEEHIGMKKAPDAEDVDDDSDDGEGGFIDQLASIFGFGDDE